MIYMSNFSPTLPTSNWNLRRREQFFNFLSEVVRYKRAALRPPFLHIFKIRDDFLSIHSNWNLSRWLQGKQGAECAAYLSVCEQLGYRSLTQQTLLKNNFYKFSLILCQSSTAGITPIAITSSRSAQRCLYDSTRVACSSAVP